MDPFSAEMINGFLFHRKLDRLRGLNSLEYFTSTYMNAIYSSSVKNRHTPVWAASLVIVDWILRASGLSSTLSSGLSSWVSKLIMRHLYLN